MGRLRLQRPAPGRGDPGLRSLDALHLATALSVREEIGALFTYDERLADAAADAGLNVAGPGR